MQTIQLNSQDQLKLHDKNLVVRRDVSIPSIPTYTSLCWKSSIHLCLHMSSFPLLLMHSPEYKPTRGLYISQQPVWQQDCQQHLLFSFLPFLQHSPSLPAPNSQEPFNYRVWENHTSRSTASRHKKLKLTVRNWENEEWLKSEPDKRKGLLVSSFLALWWRNIPRTQVLPKERVLGQNTQLTATFQISSIAKSQPVWLSELLCCNLLSLPRII